MEKNNKQTNSKQNTNTKKAVNKTTGVNKNNSTMQQAYKKSSTNNNNKQNNNAIKNNNTNNYNKNSDYTKNYKPKRSRNAKESKNILILRIALLALLLIASGIYFLFFKPDSEEVLTNSKPLSIEFLDVGQGDSILLSCDGKNMLIDAGDNNKGTTVQLALESRNVTKLDYVIGTHPHADHIGGLDVIISKFDCDKIFLPKKKTETRTCEDVYNAIEYRNYKYINPTVGDKYELGDAVFTILFAGDKNYGDDLNNYSVSVLVEHEGKKFLFTGDAEAEVEEEIIESGLLGEVDLFKAGHHGSSTSNSELLLDTIFLDKYGQPLISKPNMGGKVTNAKLSDSTSNAKENSTSDKEHYVVISCGEGNSYGHPHSETLNNLRARGVKVFRTDEQGTIKVVSENGILTFNCSPTESWLSGSGR